MPLDDQTRKFLADCFARFEASGVPVPSLPDGCSVEHAGAVLSRVLADPSVLEEYLAAAYASLGRLPAEAQDRWFTNAVPDLPVGPLLERGPLALDAAGLAWLAMSGLALEEWRHALIREDQPPGEWFFREQVRRG